MSLRLMRAGNINVGRATRFNQMHVLGLLENKHVLGEIFSAPSLTAVGSTLLN